MLEAEAARLEGLSHRDLLILMAGTGQGTDLNKKLQDKIQEIEGKLVPEEAWGSAERILAIFRRDISEVKGFKDATSSAFLAGRPDKIRIQEKGSEQWWTVEYRIKTEEVGDSRTQVHNEALSIYDNSGVGFSTSVNRWHNYEHNGDIQFISDPQIPRAGQPPIGLHKNTRFAAENAETFLTNFIEGNKSA